MRLQGERAVSLAVWPRAGHRSRQGFEKTSAEASDYTWVDHHNTLGLGGNVPIATGNLYGGCKGRGLWSTSGDRTPWPMEGGKGSKPRAVHIQIRPAPLAK